MKIRNEKVAIGTLLLASIIIFFAFGFFHLTKFETTDEHLWKYGRIKQYWQAIGNQDWEKTYINDKPGVTIALFSGVGLLFEPNPETHRTSILVKEGEKETLKFFDISRTDFINLVFRLPILIVATLALFLFFWLAWEAFDSAWIALFSTMFLALNPILIGVTQIINPDSFLWIFGGLSAFSYLAFLNKKERKFLILTGVFMGFAMLSKYTAITLFLFYFLALFSRVVFQNEQKDIKIDCRFVLREFLNILLILVIALVIFSVFLPAVFVKPAYLVKGIAQFFKRGNFSIIFIPSVLILGTVAYYRKNLLHVLTNFFVKNKRKILITVCCLFGLVILVMLVNVWSGQKIIPLDQLRDTAYANEPKKFYFGKDFAQLGTLEKNFKLFMLEAYPFTFSQNLLVFVLMVFLLAKAIFKKVENNSAAIIFSVFSFSLCYFVMTLIVRVVANVRYTITLQFLFALLAAFASTELLKSLNLQKNKYFISYALIILAISFFSLWQIRPFYFSYESPLLPKKFTINSSWGQGFYEAAQYLNSKPNAENMFIWSNSTTICPFFKGKCIDSRKMNLNVVKPDYFVISKRGAVKIRNRFEFTNPDYKGKPSEYYFDNLEDNYEWVIFIGDREENFVKVIKFEE